SGRRSGMSQLVHCERCEADRAVLGRRCVVCGWEVLAASTPRPWQGAWPLLLLAAGWIAVVVASLVGGRLEGLVLAAALSLPYLLAPSIGRTLGGVARTSAQGFARSPTEAQAGCTAWAVRGLA